MSPRLICEILGVFLNTLTANGKYPVKDWENLQFSMSPRLICEILGVFLNTLTANGKYPVKDWENLQFSIQMQLSEKWKTFSQFFLLFLESTSNFKHFETNMMVIANEFPKLQTMKNFVRQHCKKRRFGTPFHSHYVKVS